MNREEKVPRLSRLFGEDTLFIAKILDARAIKSVSNLKDLDRVAIELREETFLSRADFYQLIDEQRDLLCLKLIECATSQKEIVGAYGQSPPGGKAEVLAICKMAEILENEEKKHKSDQGE